MCAAVRAALATCLSGWYFADMVQHGHGVGMNAARHRVEQRRLAARRDGLAEADASSSGSGYSSSKARASRSVATQARSSGVGSSPAGRPS